MIGAATLAWLLYAVLATAPRGAVLGTTGLVTCVGCAWPTLGVATAVLGGGSTARLGDLSYDLSTLIYLGTLGILYWFVITRLRESETPPRAASTIEG